MKHSISPIREGEGGPRALLHLSADTPEEQESLKALVAAIGSDCREKIVAGYATNGSLLSLSIAVTSLEPFSHLRTLQTPAA